MSSAPAKTFIDYPLKATVWRNQSPKGPWYSVTTSRSYKTGDDTWAESDSLRREDLLPMARLLDQAYEWIGHQQDADRKARKISDNVTAK